MNNPRLSGSPGQFYHRQNNSQCSSGNGSEDFIPLPSGSPSFYPERNNLRQSGSPGQFYHRKNNSQYSPCSSQEYSMSSGPNSPSFYMKKNSGNWRKSGGQGKFYPGKNFHPFSNGQNKGGNNYQKRETDISLYMDPAMFEDPWAEFKQTQTTPNKKKNEFSPRTSLNNSPPNSQSSRNSPKDDSSSKQDLDISIGSRMGKLNTSQESSGTTASFDGNSDSFDS